MSQGTNQLKDLFSRDFAASFVLPVPAGRAEEVRNAAGAGDEIQQEGAKAQKPLAKKTSAGPEDPDDGEGQSGKRRTVGKHVGGRYVDLGQFSDDEEDQIVKLQDDVKKLTELISNLTEKNKAVQTAFSQYGAETQQKVDAMQRKLFEAEKANQDAFHARETLVQPDEQLDNNDRDMIDSLVKNPGIGAVVLSIVLFISGVQVTSKFSPGDSEEDGSDESKDSEPPTEKESGGLELPAFLQRPINYLKDKFARFSGALVPLTMLSVQFSYIYFIFDEAYVAYSGGVCPAYDIADRTTVPPDDGTDAKIRILMGFIGLYFTARTFSQMFSFLKALTDRTVSNKDKSQKSWMQMAQALIWSFVCARCGKSKVEVKQPSDGLTISRLNGKECSKFGCCQQGFYYTLKPTDIAKLIMTRIRVDDNQDKQTQDKTQKKWKGQSLIAKAIMEYGLSSFWGGDGFAVSLKNRRLHIQRDSAKGPTPLECKDTSGFVLKCCYRCGTEQCNRQATAPLQLGNTYVVFCRECFDNNGKRNVPGKTKQNSMRPNDLPSKCRFKGCDSQGACYLNSDSELVNAFLRTGTDKILLPKRPDQGGGIGSGEPGLLCCTMLGKKNDETQKKQEDMNTNDVNKPRIPVCIKHANEVEQYVFCEDWPLGSVDRDILCKKHAVDELSDEIAFRAEILVLDDVSKRITSSNKAKSLDDQMKGLHPALQEEALFSEWLALCEDVVQKMSHETMFSASSILDSKPSSSCCLSCCLWPCAKLCPWAKPKVSLKVGREWFQDAGTCDETARKALSNLLKTGTQKIEVKDKKSDNSQHLNSEKSKFQLEKAIVKGSIGRTYQDQYKERTTKHAAAIRWFARDFDSSTSNDSSNRRKRSDVPFKYERFCDIQGCQDTARHGILLLKSEDAGWKFFLRFCQKHAVYGATIAQHHDIEFPLLPCLKTDSVCHPVVANPEICEYQDCNDLAVHDKRFCQKHSKEQMKLFEKREQWSKDNKKTTASSSAKSAATKVANAIQRLNVDPFDDAAFSKVLEEPEIDQALGIMRKELVEDVKVKLKNCLKQINDEFQKRKKSIESPLKVLLEHKALKEEKIPGKVTLKQVHGALRDLKDLQSKIGENEAKINSEFGTAVSDKPIQDKLQLLQECLETLNAASEVMDIFNRYKTIEFAEIKQVHPKTTSQMVTNAAATASKTLSGSGTTSQNTKAEPDENDQIDPATGMPASIEAAVKKHSAKGLKFIETIAEKVNGSKDPQTPDAQLDSLGSRALDKAEQMAENAADSVKNPQEAIENLQAFVESKSKEMMQNVGNKLESALKNKLTGSFSPYAGADMWRDVQDSVIYPFYCLDASLNLALVYSALLCNLYIIFVTGSSVQDILAKIVILDFIYVQQVNLKKELFQGQHAKKSLKALKLLYNIPGPIFFNEWCRQWFAALLAILSIFPAIVSLAMIVYGPLCKPGLNKIGPSPIAKASKK